MLSPFWSIFLYTLYILSTFLFFCSVIFDNWCRYDDVVIGWHDGSLKLSASFYYIDVISLFKHRSYSKSKLLLMFDIFKLIIIIDFFEIFAFIRRYWWHFLISCLSLSELMDFHFLRLKMDFLCPMLQKGNNTFTADLASELYKINFILIYKNW